MPNKTISSDNKPVELSRALDSRHVQLIALGCAIGTGLYLGTADILKLTGPSILLAYLVAGFIVFLLMRQLGEMVVEEPQAGSFSHFAHKYWGAHASFIAGWNSWILYVLVSMAELSALGQFMQFWFPSLPTWVTVLACFSLINILNLIHVKLYAESEFWMSSIKVLAIILMIAVGGFLLLSGDSGAQSSVANLWQNEGGFFSGGLSGFAMALAPTLFSLGGLELVGITAAETNNPRKTIPRAVNQTMLLLMIFYIGSLSVLLMLFPWSQLIGGGSPFVMVFSKLGNVVAANILNIVVFSAALSVYNSCVYAHSRMLFSLAEQNNAPRFLIVVNKRGVPYAAVLMGAFVTFACVIVNYIFEEKAFGILMMLVVASVLISWTMISLSHLKFKAAMKKQNVITSFKAIGSPISNYLCVLFVAFIIFMMAQNNQWVAVSLIPIWLSFLGIAFVYKKKFYS